MINKYLKYAKIFNISKEIAFWIEHNLKNYLEKNEENQEEIEHIIDYLASKRHRRLKKMSYKQALSNTEKWMKALVKKGKNIYEKEGEDFDVILDFKDGFRVIKLKSKKSYQREGHLMSHCVSTYFNINEDIFSLRDKNNMPHCTMSKSSQQIKGKGNGKIHPKYIDYVIEFLEFLDIKVKDNDMRNLGYDVVKFPLHTSNKLFRNKYYYTKEKLEYKDDYFICSDLKEALEYKGYKAVLYDGNVDACRDKIASRMTTFGKIEAVSGFVDFSRYSHSPRFYIKDLGNLKSIGYYADFTGRRLTTLKNLEIVGASLSFGYSNISDLGKLRKIGGWVYFRHTKVTNLKNLEIIGEWANFRNSKITNLGNLKIIRDFASFDKNNKFDCSKVKIGIKYYDYLRK